MLVNGNVTMGLFNLINIDSAANKIFIFITLSFVRQIITDVVKLTCIPHTLCSNEGRANTQNISFQNSLIYLYQLRVDNQLQRSTTVSLETNHFVPHTLLAVSLSLPK